MDGQTTFKTQRTNKWTDRPPSRRRGHTNGPTDNLQHAEDIQMDGETPFKKERTYKWTDRPPSRSNGQTNGRRDHLQDAEAFDGALQVIRICFLEGVGGGVDDQLRRIRFGQLLKAWTELSATQLPLHQVAGRGGGGREGREGGSLRGGRRSK